MLMAERRIDTMTLQKAQSGSFILEALVSVLIFAIGIIALVGIAAQAVNQVGQSKARNDASYLASELIGDMWVSAATPASYNTAAWLARVQNPNNLPSGDATVTVTGTQVAIDISWADRKEPGVRHHYITTAVVARNS